MDLPLGAARREKELMPDQEESNLRAGSELFLNPFFFEIESYKDNAGVVWLRKEPGRDFQDADGDTPFKDWVGR
jgi:hypothetical protein